jgi:hypothetical protein
MLLSVPVVFEERWERDKASSLTLHLVVENEFSYLLSLLLPETGTLCTA